MQATIYAITHVREEDNVYLPQQQSAAFAAGLYAEAREDFHLFPQNRDGCWKTHTHTHHKKKSAYRLRVTTINDSSHIYL